MHDIMINIVFSFTVNPDFHLLNINVYTHKKSTISLINLQFTILIYKDENKKNRNKDWFLTVPVGRDRTGGQTQTGYMRIFGLFRGGRRGLKQCKIVL